MNLRQKFALGSLAVLGLVAAGAMGLLANAIAGDSIGLSAKPLRAGHQLAPAVADAPSAGGRQQHGSAPHQSSSGAPPAAPPAGTGVEPGDDHGGAGVDNSGPGSLNSGSDSSGPGSGSGTSGSSGSGSSGSGSSGSSGGSGDD
jgi:hypothetical protein